MQLGIQPNFIVCRSNEPLGDKAKEKIALFSSVKKERVIDDSDRGMIYQLPLHLLGQRFDRLLLQDLGLSGRKIDNGRVGRWRSTVESISSPKRRVNIAIVGKYTDLKDSYISVKEALTHAGAKNGVKVALNWIESTRLEGDGMRALDDADGILVPGGFGVRGTEGMINAIRYARENRIPFLGLCFGMQMMVIEYARNVCGMKSATSSEFDAKARYKLIDIMESQRDIKERGGTMRLGAWSARLKKGTNAYRAYGSTNISERHRHRYEVNNRYRGVLERNGLIISGTTPNNHIVEITEWKNSFGVGTQAHPELKSRLERPAPLFVSFIEKAAARSN